MSKFAVGHIDYFNNNLIIEIIKAENWKDALFKHSKLISENWDQSWFGETLEEAKNKAFDCDMMIDVIEI